VETELSPPELAMAVNSVNQLNLLRQTCWHKSADTNTP